MCVLVSLIVQCDCVCDCEAVCAVSDCLVAETVSVVRVCLLMKLYVLGCVLDWFGKGVLGLLDRGAGGGGLMEMVERWKLVVAWLWLCVCLVEVVFLGDWLQGEWRA